MSISTLRPVPRGRATDPTRTRAGALRTDEPRNIALVANGKPNSMELLDALASRLSSRIDVREAQEKFSIVDSTTVDYASTILG